MQVTYKKEVTLHEIQCFQIYCRRHKNAINGTYDSRHRGFYPASAKWHDVGRKDSLVETDGYFTGRWPHMVILSHACHITKLRC
jgi:hypothetical protein